MKQVEDIVKHLSLHLVYLLQKRKHFCFVAAQQFFFMYLFHSFFH